MDKHDFIIYMVDSFLNLEDSLNIMITSKYINKNINIKLKVNSHIKHILNSFYNTLLTDDIIELNFSPQKLIHSIPFVGDLLNTNFKPYVTNILTNCQHSHNCHICDTILYIYNIHAKGDKMYINFTPIGSFLTSVCMCLYH